MRLHPHYGRAIWGPLDSERLFTRTNLSVKMFDHLAIMDFQMKRVLLRGGAVSLQMRDSPTLSCFQT